MEQLTRWRTLGARHSEETVDLANKLLRSGGLGDEEWAVREQLAIAALDIGQLDLAKAQFEVLTKRFPNSPRLEILLGLQLEARGQYDQAKQVYLSLLKSKATNISAHQRLITLELSNSISAGITALLGYLDNFYSDPAGWSLLAELYADQQLYAQSLTALGHVMLIQPWDSAAVCRAAETAYTMGDHQLALKFALRATEMQTDPSSPGSSSESKQTRAWWCVKLSIRRLMQVQDKRQRVESSVPSESSSSPAQLKALDELATERLLAAGGKGMTIKRAVLSAEGVTTR